MNYIKHLNAVFHQFSKDSRLNPTHISLYIALFQFWNRYRFPEIFYIIREEVMKLAKIGFKSTYHQCLKALDQCKNIRYLPSHNPLREVVYRCPFLGQVVGQVLNQLWNK